MSWSKNNQACLSTWFSLLNLEQTKKTFAKAKTQQMQDLTFYNPESKESLRRAAHALARQLNNLFKAYDGATCEKGVTETTAVVAMQEVLVVAEQTIADLAATVDQNYLFLEEGR